MSDAVLKEIRDRFSYCVEAWRDIRAEAREDMKFVSGDPWDPKERKARKDANRPCLSLDELNQYLNQRCNDVRMNPRAIKVSPGDDAGDDGETTAELHADIIRTIEYKSNAQAAYVTAFENALQRSYGYFRIGKRYSAPKSFNQELFIARIPNPDSVYMDPDCKQADCSDARYAFLLEDIPHDIFRSRWPNAERKDFPSELLTSYPQWVKERTVQVAEYWKVQTRKRTLLLAGDEANPITVFKDELDPGSAILKGNIVYPDGEIVPILRQRVSEERSIVQYITNGVEILEENEWEGKWIPIIPVFGKEIFVDRGVGAERIILSLIRLARDAQMLYAYYRTCEAELVGMVPKTPWVGYEGQFEGHEVEWQSANRVPYAYLQVKPVLDATGTGVLPLPQRQIYEAPIQALEMGAESAKRAIQNALGMYNASVGRQDTAAKSGRAIKELDIQSDQGNFHFIDNYDRALEHAGRILDDMIPRVYDTARQIAVRKPDETQSTVKINQPSPDPKTGKVRQLRTGGEHDVTISTGPSFQSQREEVSDFADSLAQRPEIFALVGDLVVKMKQLGPIGDEIAERLTPPQFAKDKQNPQIMAQQLEQTGQMVEALTKQLTALTEERNAKTLEIQAKQQMEATAIESKERIEAMKAEVELAKINAQLSSKENMEMLKAELEHVHLSIEALKAINTPAPQAGEVQ